MVDRIGRQLFAIGCDSKYRHCWCKHHKMLREDCGVQIVRGSFYEVYPVSILRA